MTDVVKKEPLSIEDLYKRHEDDTSDGGRGYHTWQNEIFKRVYEAVSGDEEAVCLLKHTLDYAESKSVFAGD